MAFFKWVMNSDYVCHVCKLKRKAWEHNVFDGDDILDVVGNGVHASDVLVCLSCSNEQNKLNRQHKSTARSVETFSHRYKGKLPKTDKPIYSPKLEDRDEAEMHLKLLAVLDNKSVITNLEFSKSTESQMKFNKKGKHTGDYKHSVWQASGMI